MMRTRVSRALAAGAILMAAAVGLRAQTVPFVNALTAEWPETLKIDGIEIVPVQGNVYLLAGGGGNVTIHIGDEGVVMVDTGAPGQATRLQNAVRRLTRKPLRYLISTGPDPDHIGGSGEMVRWAGGTSGPQAGGGGGRPPNVGATVIAHEGTYNRMINGTAQLPALTGDALPNSTFFTPRKDVHANGQPIQLFHAPSAVTDGDLMVFFRSSDVVAAGDVFRTDRYPMVDLARGGSINGELAALNHLLEIAVPQRNQMGGTLVVPGHGRIGNESDVLEYRDMLTIVRDRVQMLIERGQTLDQVRAARVSLEYDGLYGKDREWTGDMFLEAVYNSLKK